MVISELPIVWRAAEASQRTGRVRSVAPVLAVEVAGEDEHERALTDKAQWYLAHGVALVWLVLPETREVVVIHSNGAARFDRTQRLPATERLPDLEPEVARLFAQLDR